jgi:hypothetical protein
VLLSPARTQALVDPDNGQSVLPMQFLDAVPRGEIYPPADHAGVITVGDASTVSAVGPTADGRLKPDVILADSVARFTNGDETSGSSNAAAAFAGVIAVLKAHEPGLKASHIRQWVKQVDRQRTDARPTPPTQRVSAPEVLLSPNEQRALKYTEAVLDEKRIRGEPNPRIVVSSGGSSLALPVSPSTPKVAPPPSSAGVLVHTTWATPTPRILAELVRSR